MAGWEVARLVSKSLKFYCLSSVQLSLASQGGRVTSFVDNQGGVKVVQNLETAVRKNIEIQQVASKCFTGATILNLGPFSGEQQHHQDNQVQKRKMGERTGAGKIKIFTLVSFPASVLQSLQ